MAIATITPQDRLPGATLTLAQALNGGNNTLNSFLNMAIQRGRDANSLQASQENAFLAEQQRNIANERELEKMKQEQARWIMNFAENRKSREIRDGIALGNYNMQRDDFARALDFHATPAYQAAQSMQFEQNRESRADRGFDLNEAHYQDSNRRAEEGFQINKESHQRALAQQESEKAARDAYMTNARTIQLSGEGLNAAVPGLGDAYTYGANEQAKKQIKADPRLTDKYRPEVLRAHGFDSEQKKEKRDVATQFTAAERSEFQARARKLRFEIEKSDDPVEKEIKGQQALIFEEQARTGRYAETAYPPSDSVPAPEVPKTKTDQEKKDEKEKAKDGLLGGVGKNRKS